MLSPFNLPDGILLLITDELSSSADFLLHQSLIAHLKEAKNTKCIVLSVSEEFARWKAIAAKYNLNLSNHLKSGPLLFVDVLSNVQPRLPSDGSEKPSLRPIFDLVASELDVLGPGSRLLVILDDISSLEWMGFSTIDISRFSRALRAICLKANRQDNASLIIRHHIVVPNGADDLFRHLLQMATYHMDVRPLSSGKSGSVSGEIALHAGPTARDCGVKLLPRSSAVQYRLTDTGAVFFERGTGGGVL